MTGELYYIFVVACIGSFAIGWMVGVWSEDERHNRIRRDKEELRREAERRNPQ